MNEPKFTPGPWFADVRSGCLAVYPEKDKAKWNCLSGASTEAIHYNAKGAKYVDDPATGGGGWDMDNEARANAYIIAAAPEMYAAIREFLRLFESGNCHDIDRVIIGPNHKLAAALRESVDKADGNNKKPPLSERLTKTGIDMNNLQIVTENVKSGVGPFLGRMSCVEAACQDKHCIALKAFTVIKSRARGTYDYVPGSAQLLMSDDVPIADYWVGITGQWRYKLRQENRK